MPHRHRLDANHHDLRTAARRVGWCWLDTAQTGIGFDALLVKGGRTVFVEVKDGTKPLSAQQLTTHEKEVHATLKAHGVRVEILTCEADLLMLERPQPHRRTG